VKYLVDLKKFDEVRINVVIEISPLFQLELASWSRYFPASSTASTVH